MISVFALRPTDTFSSGAWTSADIKTGVDVSSLTRAWYHIRKPQLPPMPTRGPASLSELMAATKALRSVSS
jgi:hypothetical protein